MNRLNFAVTRLEAVAPAGVPLTWQGRTFNSGPLQLDLDTTPSHGSLDYAAGRAASEFHVRLHMPEFSELLLALGADPALAQPLRATLKSEGAINADHSFSLSGGAVIAKHALLEAEAPEARVLPGT